MNRLTFLELSLSLSGIAWVQLQQPAEISQKLLLGQGNPKLIGGNTPLLEPVYHAFKSMQNEAAKDGIALSIVSAYRSYDRQKAIWNRKFAANQKAGLSPQDNLTKIIEYSTLPGTSRHHWGTEFDIIDGNVPREGDVLLTEKFHGQGPYAPLRKWMDCHAANYGFLRPYTNNPNRKGFYYEPWHYSFATLAKKYLTAYRKLDLQKALKTDGLLGKTYLNKTFLTRYYEENILGIHPDLL